MKPFGVDETGAVCKDGVENAAFRSRLNSTAAINAGVNRSLLPRLQRVQWNEIRAVLIRLWNVKQQVFNRADTPRCQQRRTPRPYALHILDIRIESKHVLGFVFRLSTRMLAAERLGQKGRSPCYLFGITLPAPGAGRETAGMP